MYPLLLVLAKWKKKGVREGGQGGHFCHGSCCHCNKSQWIKTTLIYINTCLNGRAGHCCPVHTGQPLLAPVHAHQPSQPSCSCSLTLPTLVHAHPTCLCLLPLICACPCMFTILCACSHSSLTCPPLVPAHPRTFPLIPTCLLVPICSCYLVSPVGCNMGTGKPAIFPKRVRQVQVQC